MITGILKNCQNAYAKINLFLDITSVRNDCYHEISSLMQTIELHDDVEITVYTSDTFVEPEINVKVANTDTVPDGESNIAWKAAKMFIEHFGCGKNFVRKIDISIFKRIPSPGGLGGGSADAAAVIRALNQLFSLNIDISTLMAFGAKIGADVPFCICQGCASVKGIGEIVLPIQINYPENMTFVVSNLGSGMPTPLAFSLLDEKYQKNFVKDIADTNSLCDIAALIEAFNKNDYSGISANTYNIFEEILLIHRPEVAKLTKIMKQTNAVTCFLSGSGPSVVGIYQSKEDAEIALIKFKNIGALAYVAKPIYP